MASWSSEEEWTTKEYLTGLGWAAAAAVLRSSAFVSTRALRSADGVAYHWLFSAAVWGGGLIAWASVGFPAFHAAPMIGGGILSLSLFLTIPCVALLGLAPAFCLWTAACSLARNLIYLRPYIGKAVPTSPSWFYWIARALVAVSVVGFVFVRARGLPCQKKQGAAARGAKKKKRRGLAMPGDDDDQDDRELVTRLLSDEYSLELQKEALDTDKEAVERSPINRVLSAMPEGLQRTLGVVLALVSGTLLGVQFIPVHYQVDVRDAWMISAHGGDAHAEFVVCLGELFSWVCGCFVVSSALMILYALVSLNKPSGFTSKSALPALLSGATWFASFVAWLCAATSLRPSFISPSVDCLSSLLACLWGLLLFREVSSILTFIVLGLSLLLYLTGTLSLAVGFSRVIPIPWK